MAETAEVAHRKITQRGCVAGDEGRRRRVCGCHGGAPPARRCQPPGLAPQIRPPRRPRCPTSARRSTPPASTRSTQATSLVLLPGLSSAGAAGVEHGEAHPVPVPRPNPATQGWWRAPAIRRAGWFCDRERAAPSPPECPSARPRRPRWSLSRWVTTRVSSRRTPPPAGRAADALTAVGVGREGRAGVVDQIMAAVCTCTASPCPTSSTVTRASPGAGRRPQQQRQNIASPTSAPAFLGQQRPDKPREASTASQGGGAACCQPPRAARRATDGHHRQREGPSGQVGQHLQRQDRETDGQRRDDKADQRNRNGVGQRRNQRELLNSTSSAGTSPRVTAHWAAARPQPPVRRQPPLLTRRAAPPPRRTARSRPPSPPTGRAPAPPQGQGQHRPGAGLRRSTSAKATQPSM